MGGKQEGTSKDTISAERSGATALTQIASQQNQRAGTLFDIGLPGVRQAEQFYGSLATGDPWQISRAIAPETQQITKATESAKSNILQNASPGGEKNLALEQAELQRGAQVGDVATKAHLGSFNALASLGGQNIQQSTGAANTGIGAIGTGGQILGQIGGQEFQNAQFQAEQKGSAMGGIASFAGDAAQLAMMAFA